MASKVGNITFYADQPHVLAAFWSAVLGYPEARFDGDLREQLIGGGLTDDDLAKRALIEDPAGETPRIFFHHAGRAKAGRNRIHLDVQATPGREAGRDELDAEARRIIGLGATLVRLVDQDWGPVHETYYQLQDPEGNEFCLQ